MTRTHSPSKSCASRDSTWATKSCSEKVAYSLFRLQNHSRSFSYLLRRQSSSHKTSKNRSLFICHYKWLFFGASIHHAFLLGRAEVRFLLSFTLFPTVKNCWMFSAIQYYHPEFYSFNLYTILSYAFGLTMKRHHII